MPQRSYAYAVGRVQVLSQTLLSAAALERMTTLRTVEELSRALIENNWADVRTHQDIDDAAARHVRDACLLMRDCSPNQAVTDCFLIRYDVINLKALLKARVLNKLDELHASECGLIAPARIRRMVEESRYTDLPRPLKEAMDRVEKRISVRMDPLYVDSEIDRAMYAYIFERLKDVKNDVIHNYFVCRVDTINLLIAIRCSVMGKGGQFAKDLFLPHGSIAPDALQKVADDPDRAVDAIMGKPYFDALAPALRKGATTHVSEVEKAADDYLMGQIRPHRGEITSVLPLVGYLLARQREAGAVRLLATAKAAQVSDEIVQARLRALY